MHEKGVYFSCRIGVLFHHLKNRGLMGCANSSGSSLLIRGTKILRLCCRRKKHCKNCEDLWFKFNLLFCWQKGLKMRRNGERGRQLTGKDWQVTGQTTSLRCLAQFSGIELWWWPFSSCSWSAGLCASTDLLFVIMPVLSEIPAPVSQGV